MKKINFDETIAAIATSSKDGSISIIRVSGKESLEIVTEEDIDKFKKVIEIIAVGSLYIIMKVIKLFMVLLVKIKII